MKQKIAFSVSGLPGSGSTTCGRNLAKILGLGSPHYSGGAARCLAKLRDEIGEDIIAGMYRDCNEDSQDNCGRTQLKKMVTNMMVSGVPPRPNIAAEYASFPPEFDFAIDDVQRELLAQESTAVHEGRMVPHLVQQLKDAGLTPPGKIFVRIFCDADKQERMRRLQKRDEYQDASLEHIEQETDRRLQTEQKRYQVLYGIDDHIAREHFDIIIDTTHFSPQETLAELLRRIEDLHPGLLAPYLQHK